MGRTPLAVLARGRGVDVSFPGPGAGAPL